MDLIKPNDDQMNFYPFFHLVFPCTINETSFYHPSFINLSLSPPCNLLSRFLFLNFFCKFWRERFCRERFLKGSFCKLTKGRGKGIKTGILESSNKTAWQLEKSNHTNWARFVATERERDSTDTNNLRTVCRYAFFSYIAIHSSNVNGNIRRIPWLSTNTMQSCFSHTTKYIYT